MKYMFDTNAAISLIARKSRSLIQRVAASEPGAIAIPAMVAHELYYGAYRSARTSFNLDILKIFLGEFGALPFDTEDARVAGEVRASLAARGTPIGPFDILIAAQGLARDLVIITNNVREFSRVDGLRIEDWSAA